MGIFGLQRAGGRIGDEGQHDVIANGKIERPVSAAELRDIHSFLQMFEDKKTR